MKVEMTKRKYTRYAENDILKEACMFCKERVSIAEIAKRLRVPRSTVSWHLLYPLKNIDYSMWVAVRKECFIHAKKPEYYMDETDLIEIGVTHKEG